MQVVQDIRKGTTTTWRVNTPTVSAQEVLVANTFSLISAGTERYVVQLAKKSLAGKALSRPDHVRRVVEKVRQEGLITTAQQVFAKLGEPMPLGYSSAGTVLECGREVQSFKPGDRVAAAAPHSSIVAISHQLCAKIPASVTLEQASMSAVGAIALQGVRQAKLELGERVLVIGLGLVGQLAAGLCKAQGCRVFGLDLDTWKLGIAMQTGCDQVAQSAVDSELTTFAGTSGFDAVLITAATESNAPIELAAKVCRQKGRVVLVGVAGLNLPRAPFYEKELEFTVSHSLGAGRGDRFYEEKGQDYPIGYARWTPKRNMEAFLDILSQEKLNIAPLLTHRFAIEKAEQAYDLITTGAEKFLGITLNYGESTENVEKRIHTHQPFVKQLLKTSKRQLVDKSPKQSVELSVIGAGNFARLTMLPILGQLKGFNLRGVASARGLNAADFSKRFDFAYSTTDADEIFGDDTTNAILIATRHDQHAELVQKALAAGKHVFVEKPLCLTLDELETITALVGELGNHCPVLMVGFNRRFAPSLQSLVQAFAHQAPLSVSFRFVAGEISADHWTQDMSVGGGRIIGEACHAIDTVTAMHNSSPVRIYAESIADHPAVETTDDRVFITLRHANGGISQVSYQAGGDKGGPKERIEVFGGGSSGFVDDWRSLTLVSKGEARKPKVTYSKGHREELACFLQACQRGSCPIDQWPIPWKQLRTTSWASTAAIDSIRLGVPINLALDNT